MKLLAISIVVTIVTLCWISHVAPRWKVRSLTLLSVMGLMLCTILTDLDYQQGQPPPEGDARVSISRGAEGLTIRMSPEEIERRRARIRQAKEMTNGV